MISTKMFKIKKISTKLKIFQFFKCITNSNTDSSWNVWKYMKAHKTFTISKLGNYSLLNLSVSSSASGALSFNQLSFIKSKYVWILICLDKLMIVWKLREKLPEATDLIYLLYLIGLFKWHRTVYLFQLEDEWKIYDKLSNKLTWIANEWI